MTTQEKAMHDKVMDGFSQKYLRSVRDAVGKREIKPDENELPFRDIANIIRFCNESILNPEDYSNTNTRAEAKNSKFDKIDAQWYRKILKIAINGVENDVPPIQSKPISVVEYKVEVDETVAVNKNNLLPLDAYTDIKQIARGCEGAIAIVESAASKDRPLTHKDASDILYEKAICETKKLNENL
jgi:hypothetical protein